LKIASNTGKLRHPNDSDGSTKASNESGAGGFRCEKEI